MSEQMSPAMKALKDMKEGRVTAESKQLAQVNRAVTNRAGGTGTLNENVEIKEREIPDHQFTTSNNNRSGGEKSPIEEDLIRGLIEGRVRQGVPQVQRLTAPQSQPQKTDILTATNQLMESIEPRSKSQLESVNNSREILREVVANLRKGGVLKEEIVKVVMEEALTETVLRPIMEKHFKRMLREFLQERKKG